MKQALFILTSLLIAQASYAQTTKNLKLSPKEILEKNVSTIKVEDKPLLVRQKELLSNTKPNNIMDLSNSKNKLNKAKELGFEGQDRGGGNMLGGKMIESYIKSPLEELKDGRALNERLQIVKSKSEDLYSLLMEGLHMGTWYFIPASLKELSQNITGIPFSSDQTAVQVFSTQEIWVDQSIYSSADPSSDEFGGSIEREKLLVHESIMAGLNSMMDGYLIPSSGYFDMEQFKRRVRKLTMIVFDPNLRNLTTDDITKRISQAGFLTGSNGEFYCLKELVDEREVTGVYPTYRPKRCSNASKYNK
ncbi:MAG: hypothetical protein WA160_14780 [Pseudobdellovibrio sp.]